MSPILICGSHVSSPRPTITYLPNYSISPSGSLKLPQAGKPKLRQLTYSSNALLAPFFISVRSIIIQLLIKITFRSKTMAQEK